MSTESDRAIRFRCAETGRRFIVVFHRPGPAIRFVVVNVVDETEFAPKKPSPKKAKTARQIETPAQSQAQSLRKLLPALFGAIPLVGRFVSGPDREHAVEKAPPKQTTKTSPSNNRQQQPPPPPGGQYSGQYGDAFDINEFNFNGWYCPCCGHGKEKEPQIQFVRCSKCREYVCGARVSTLADGQVMFICHDKCGNRGLMGQGRISAMSGMGLDQKKPALLNDLASRQMNSGQPSAERRLPSGKEEDGVS